MIIFFYGADGFRISRATTEIKNKFSRDLDPNGDSLVLIDGGTTDLKNLNSKINSGSLFTEKRLIIVNDLFKNKKESLFKELLPWLKNIAEAENIITVFKEEKAQAKKGAKSESGALKGDKKKVYEFLKSQKYSQEFKQLEGQALKLFVKNELKQYNKEISLGAAETLIAYFSNDLWTLSRELKKLAFLNNKKIISEADVKETVQEIFNENIFALSDAIGSRNKKLIFSILEEQRQAGLSDEHILASLRNHLRNLLLIKIASESLNDSTKIASNLKLHPFVIKKGLAQARNFEKEQLKNYFNQLIRIDFLNKKGLSSLENELFLLLTSI